MSRRRAIPAVIAAAFAVCFFGLGGYLAARQNATSDERIASLRAEVELLRQRDLHEATGTSGHSSVPPVAAMDTGRRGQPVAQARGAHGRKL